MSVTIPFFDHWVFTRDPPRKDILISGISVRDAFVHRFNPDAILLSLMGEAPARRPHGRPFNLSADPDDGLRLASTPAGISSVWIAGLGDPVDLDRRSG